MDNFYKIAIIATVFSILTACGGDSGALTKSETNSSNQVAANTSPVSTANNNASLPPINQPSDANTIAERKSPNQGGLVSSENNPSSNVQVITIDPNQKTAKNPSITVSDGSEISTVLGEKGAIETRTFKNNPQLSKLERTTIGKDVSVKVFLKNGKVVPIDKEKIQNFTNDSAELILRAAGVEPKPTPAQKPETKSGEKTYTFTFPVKPAN